MIILENNELRAEISLRGAALNSLIFKPIGREMCWPISAGAREDPQNYYGTIVGPLANRVANARFTHDGEMVTLDANEGRNSLHGGAHGLSERDWEISENSEGRVVLRLRLEDGDAGMPGPVDYEAEYALEGATLRLALRAFAHQDSFVNLAPHFYFAADEGRQIDDLSMQISAPHFLPVDGELIPTGEIADVRNTRFDFQAERLIGADAIDHNFCLDAPFFLQLAGQNWRMKVETNQQGMQIYTGDHMGRKAMAIEPQGWPNSVNEAEFPSQEFGAGERYENLSRWSFEQA